MFVKSFHPGNCSRELHVSTDAAVFSSTSTQLSTKKPSGFNYFSQIEKKDKKKKRDVCLSVCTTASTQKVWQRGAVFEFAAVWIRCHHNLSSVGMRGCIRVDVCCLCAVSSAFNTTCYPLADGGRTFFPLDDSYHTLNLTYSRVQWELDIKRVYPVLQVLFL